MRKTIPDEVLLALASKNSGGGSGGTTNYNDLNNKPQIAGVTLSGNKSLSDLGIASAEALNGKVDKVEGKGLSTNDYTDADKGIVSGVTGALAGKQDNLGATKDANNDVTFLGNVIDGQGNVLSEVSALEQSASGNPIIVNAQGIDAKELSVEFGPDQDLHGYDHPWVGGAEKNKLNATLANMKSGNSRGTWNGNVYTYQGLDFEPIFDNDGNFTHVKVTGTATALTQFYVNYDAFTPSGNFILNGCPNGGSYSTFDLRTNDINDAHADCVDVGSGVAVNRTETGLVGMSVIITVRSGYNCGSGIIFKPMIRLSTESDPTFAPYSNVCPISGRTEARVDDVGKNVIPLTVASAKSNNTGGTWSGNTYTINGGKIEVLSDDGTTVKGLKLNGTFSAMSAFAIYFNYTAKAAMTLNGCPSGGGVSSYQLDINGGQNPDTGSGSTIAANTAVTNVRLRIGSGFTANGQIIKPMLSYEGGAYEPYRETVSATIQLGQTVYGARINFKTGEGIVDRALATFNGSSGFALFDTVTDGKRYVLYSPFADAKRETTYSEVIASSYKCVLDMPVNNGEIAFRSSATPQWLMVVSDKATITDFNNELNANPLQVCYKLATPIELTLTPSMLKLLEGYNYITADGEMQLVYIPESVLEEAQKYTYSVASDKVDNSVVGTVENGTTASKAYAVGEHFIRNKKFCTAIASIASGAAFTLGTNYVEGSISDNLVKRETVSGTTDSGGLMMIYSGTDRNILSCLSNTGDRLCSVYKKNTSGATYIRVMFEDGSLANTTAMDVTYYYI